VRPEHQLDAIGAVAPMTREQESGNADQIANRVSFSYVVLALILQ
jgi:hypothetical protein